MSSSLRDQLLRAGLVTEEQVKKASQPQRVPSRHKPPPPPSPAQLAAQKAAADKAARDQELNRKKQEKADRKARRAQVHQLIEQIRIPKLESDDYFNFVDGKTIERIMVNAELRGQIGRGELIVVRYRGHYALVPAAETQRVRDIDASALVTLGSAAESSSASASPDDPYKDFVVPDDLTW